NCQKAHLACDVSRPCKRCVQSGREDTCFDVQHKKRGRPRRRDRQPLSLGTQDVPALASEGILAPELVRSSFTMTRPPGNNVADKESVEKIMVTLFLSMDICCARVSDESLDVLGIYPHEFAHRSLYDFILPEHTDRLARIHRCLLDNANRQEKRILPPTQRTTSECFASTSPSMLLNIANGSLTLKEPLGFKTSSGSHVVLNTRFYLGGGLGADLFVPTSLERLYIICLATAERAVPEPNIHPFHLLPSCAILDDREIDTIAMQQPVSSPPKSSPRVLNTTPQEHVDASRNSRPAGTPRVKLPRPEDCLLATEEDDRRRRRNSKDHLVWHHPREVYLRETTSSRLLSAQASSVMGSCAVEAGKKLAAYQAVNDYITPEHKVVGIGSGSTVVYAVERILQRPELKNIVYVPTSFQSKLLIIDGGLTMGTVDQFPEIDVTIDGADEVDENLNAIKGGGACQFQEKVVAEAAKKFVIIAVIVCDLQENSKVIKKQWTKGVPIEVVPMTYKSVIRSLENKLSMKPQQLTLRMAVNKAGPVVTDNGNFVIDAHFGAIEDPATLLKEIKLLTGVYEVGLFCNMAETAYFGEADGTVSTLKK
ncbi:ribose 5-phosphate isomerase A-domain-containing protein, partial [Fennellomyces sp. T-0311]